MKTNEMTREQISALADGELDDAHTEVALAALRDDAARADWRLYHQIGDVMRSDEMAIDVSEGFSARFAARLDAEPTCFAPAAAAPAAVARRSSLRAWQSMAAAAAIATFAFVVTPPLLDALKGESLTAPNLAATPVAEDGLQDTQDREMVAASLPEGVILRDPRIDEYLTAHQRFSPSVNGSAQYARSATFTGK